jgi:hypothetical protein
MWWWTVCYEPSAKKALTMMRRIRRAVPRFAAGGEKWEGDFGSVGGWRWLAVPSHWMMMEEIVLSVCPADDYLSVCLQYILQVSIDQP